METGHSKTNRDLKYNMMAKCKSPHELYRTFGTLAAWKYRHGMTDQPPWTARATPLSIFQRAGVVLESPVALQKGRTKMAAEVAGSADASDSGSQEQVRLFQEAAVGQLDLLTLASQLGKCLQ